MSLKRHPNPIAESPTNTETTSALHFQSISSARLGVGFGGGGGGGGGGGQVPFGGTPRKNSRIDEFHCSKIEPVQEEATSPARGSGFDGALQSPSSSCNSSSAFASDRRHTVSGAGASNLRHSHRKLAQHSTQQQQQQLHQQANGGETCEESDARTTTNPLVMVTEWASTEAAGLQATVNASGSSEGERELEGESNERVANGLLSPSFSASMGSDESGSELGELPSRPRLSSMCSRNRAHAVPMKSQSRRSSDTTQTQPVVSCSIASNPMFLLPLPSSSPAYPAPHTYAVTAQLATVQPSPPMNGSPHSASPSPVHHQHHHQHQQQQHYHPHNQLIDCGVAPMVASIERPRAHTLQVDGAQSDTSREYEMQREYDRLQKTIDQTVSPGAHGHGVLEQQDDEVHDLRRKASAGSNNNAVLLRNGYTHTLSQPQPQPHSMQMPGMEVCNAPTSVHPDVRLPCGGFPVSPSFMMQQSFTPPGRADRGDSGISPDLVSPAYPSGLTAFAFVHNDYIQQLAAAAAGAGVGVEMKLQMQPPAGTMPMPMSMTMPMPNSHSGLMFNSLVGAAGYAKLATAMENTMASARQPPASQSHFVGGSGSGDNMAHVCSTGSGTSYTQQAIDICVTDDAGHTTGPIPISSTS